ncbi:type VI secretion system baseplate subunit TssG [Massilia genomosp. 1]|uniref:Type VI secretion system baseplate subunit TssG n=1 Tax=Massilia genomosp. 1 TaxID=2609280 RepID=A0ABX0MU42_9BURK|nr:type VI secretion system baseplate subunit TssG [Massilia genomosp. 1]NHZ66240.1 type VI secretion system baseplate subunit TssG [Massilia genomosp. 1]
MLATKRRFEPAVIERLFEEPYRFQFFQAVRMLELWLKRHGSPQQSAIANFLRFQNSTSLAFPPSELEKLEPVPRELPRQAKSLGEALQSNTLKYIRITPAFMGLLGVAGALPAHYTDRISAHIIYNKDEGPRAFLDTFSSRSVALFFEAWRKYRLELKYAIDGKDSFLPLLLSLAGVGNDSLRHRLNDELGGGVLDESLGYFASALRHRPPSAVQISRVLSEYFGKRVKAEQFIGCWYEVPTSQQTMLGAANSMLGAGAMAGERVWQRDLRLRLVVGPLDHDSFNSFLPGGKAARALKSMITMFTGVSLEYEVQLVLRGPDVHGMQMDATRTGGRLGWDSFLVTRALQEDRNDVRYDIHAL